MHKDGREPERAKLLLAAGCGPRPSLYTRTKFPRGSTSLTAPTAAASPRGFLIPLRSVASRLTRIGG